MKDKEYCISQNYGNYYLTLKHKLYMFGGSKTDKKIILDFTIEELAKALEYNCIVEPAYTNSSSGNGKFSAKVYSNERKHITKYLNEIIIPHILLGKFCK